MALARVFRFSKQRLYGIHHARTVDGNIVFSAHEETPSYINYFACQYRRLCTWTQ